MADTNPLENSHSKAPPTVSASTFHIAGILTTVYGIEEVPASCKSISCLWLLHPRLQTKQTMAQIACSCINDWNQRQSSDQKLKQVGLIAVAFDQRNHGSREVHPLSNEAWRNKNPTHAQDMFSTIHGTAVDTSLLIDHLGSYIFNGPGAPPIEQHLVLGVSLGGHAAWQVIFNEPRVSAAVIIIGCPDYMRVMTDRARLSKLETYTSSNGASFLGSKDFPAALVSAVKKSEPRGLIFGTSEIPTTPSGTEQKRIREIFDSRIRGKRFLICSGGKDKLVPYHCSEPFLQFFKNATSGWYKDGNVYVEDNVYPGVGHAFSEGMVKDSIRFVSDEVASTVDKEGKPTSKM